MTRQILEQVLKKFENKNITEIEIDINIVNFNQSTLDLIAEELKQCTSLKKIKILSSLEEIIKSYKLANLINSIFTLPIEELEFQNIMFYSQYTDLLADRLKYNKSLKKLVFRKSYIQECAIDSIFREVFKENKSLKKIDLNNNEVTALSDYNLERLSLNQILEELNLSNNKITIKDSEIDEYIKYFKKNNSLISLDLRGNEGISANIIARIRQESNLLYINGETTSHYDMLIKIVRINLLKARFNEGFNLKDLSFLRKHQNQVIYLLQHEFKYSTEEIDNFINVMEINLADKIFAPYSVFPDLPLEVLANICKNIPYEGLKNLYLANLQIKMIEDKNKIIQKKEEIKRYRLSEEEKNSVKNYKQEKGIFGWLRSIIKSILRFFSIKEKQELRSDFVEVLSKIDKDTSLSEEEKVKIEYGGVLYINQDITEENNKTESNMGRVCKKIISKRTKIPLEKDEIVFKSYGDYVTKMKEKPRNYEGLC